MIRLAQTYGFERRDTALSYERAASETCRFQGCETARIVNQGEAYDFCMRHLLRIDRKIGFTKGFMESLAQIPAPREHHPDVKSDGVVYFMLIGNEVKIGFTTDLKQRAQTLKAKRVLAYFPGDMHAEKAAHDAFREWQTHGEYHAATPECLAMIARLTARKAA